MTRSRALLLALALLAVAYPAASTPVLAAAVDAAAWLAARPTLLLTLTAAALAAWALHPHRATQIPGGAQT